MSVFTSSPAGVRAPAAAAGPIRNASAAARKSGLPATPLQAAGGGSQQETRTARKTSGARIYRDEISGGASAVAVLAAERVVHSIVEKSEDENTSPARSNSISNRSIGVKSSSATSPSMTSIVAGAIRPPVSASTNTADEGSSLPPLVQSRRGNKDNIAAIPPGANRPGLGKGKGKNYGFAGAGGKGKLLPMKRPNADTATTSSDTKEDDDSSAVRRPEETDTEEDQSSSLNVRSRSPRGYTWEVEVLEIKPEDVRHRVSYHNSITTTIEREGKNERVRFRRGDKIWILPDPQWLPPVSHEVEINELADDEWWVGEILDCCALDQESQQSGSLGLLRVAWYYSPDHAYKLDDLHSDWKKQIRKYRFNDPERIKSDHVDFVGIECFAGFADGIYTFLNISGLEVDDVERMKPPHRRKKSNRIVRMTGFTLKEVAQRAAAREAELERNPGIARRVKRGQNDRSSRRRLEPVEPEEDEERAEDPYNYD